MIDMQKAQHIVDQYKHMDGGLIECLHALQHAFDYVPDETVNIAAEGFNISRAEVHGVISYYHDFRRKPHGKTVIKVCQAEACQAMGSRELTDHVKKTLGMEMGETNEDYSLEPVYCFGNCALSPNIEINGRLHARVGQDDFDALLKREANS